MPDPRSVLPSTATIRRAPGSRGGALLGPAAGRLIQGVRVQVLQGPPERGLARHHAGDAERIPGGLVSIGGPFRDGRERPGAGQHRAQRQAQDHRPAGDAPRGVPAGRGPRPAPAAGGLALRSGTARR